MAIENKEKEALKRFLLDLKSLEKITQRSSFNPFDVLKIARTEIRHSNMLAWLLDPNESHGLGSRIVSALVEYVVKNNFVNEEDAFNLLLKSKDDVTLKREWKNIDILIESVSARFVICIENKIDTQDHSQQLDKYYRIIESETKYCDFIKVFLYLTPDGRIPNEDNADVWEMISYPDIIAIIEKELERANLNDEARMFINYYIDILRRETMEDNELIRICQQIYNEHKQALDLIFEYRPDFLQDVSLVFDEWCKEKANQGEIIYDADKSNKTYHRFRTHFMDEMMASTTTEECTSTWNTKNHYFYEIGACMDKETVKFDIHFVVNSEGLNETQAQFLLDYCSKLGFKKTPKPKWKFITPETNTKKKPTISPEEFAAEDARKDIFKILDEAWNALRKKVEK